MQTLNVLSNQTVKIGWYKVKTCVSLVQTFKEQSSVLTAALNYYCSLRALGGLAFGQAAPIEAETLVVWGEQDSALSTKLLDGFTGVAPRVRVHRWPDVSHWVQNAAPEEPNQLLLEFLGSHVQPN